MRATAQRITVDDERFFASTEFVASDQLIIGHQGAQLAVMLGKQLG